MPVDAVVGWWRWRCFPRPWLSFPSFALRRERGARRGRGKEEERGGKGDARRRRGYKAQSVCARIKVCSLHANPGRRSTRCSPARPGGASWGAGTPHNLCRPRDCDDSGRDPLAESLKCRAHGCNGPRAPSVFFSQRLGHFVSLTLCIVPCLSPFAVFPFGPGLFCLMSWPSSIVRVSQAPLPPRRRCNGPVVGPGSNVLPALSGRCVRVSGPSAAFSPIPPSPRVTRRRACGGQTSLGLGGQARRCTCCPLRPRTQRRAVVRGAWMPSRNRRFQPVGRGHLRRFVSP